MGWLAAIASILGAGANIFGATQKPKTSAAVPADLGPMRGQILQLLQGFLKNPGSANNYFFGPQTDLQRQARGNFSNLLSQPAPEQRAFDISLPALQSMLTGNPNQDPQFNADIGAANSQGDRFSSANAILRGEAFKHLYNNRTNAANTLGTLASAAGQGPFMRGLAANQYADTEQMRQAQLLSSIFGGAESAVFGVPTVQQPNTASAVGSGLGDLGQLLMLFSMLGGNKGGTPATT